MSKRTDEQMNTLFRSHHTKPGISARNVAFHWQIPLFLGFIETSPLSLLSLLGLFNLDFKPLIIIWIYQ